MPPENSSQKDLSKASSIPDMLDSAPEQKPDVPSIPVIPPAPPVVAPPPVAPEPAEPTPAPIDATNSGYLKQIRTYQGDIAEALHNEDASLVSIRAAEK